MGAWLQEIGARSEQLAVGPGTKPVHQVRVAPVSNHLFEGCVKFLQEVSAVRGILRQQQCELHFAKAMRQNV